ncbi:MAG TPA: enoyl-CoA hydratase-related protein [Acidisarcina sp.]|nr:enoyl-CoA hydratase-related protein [Acidisarcina sp.]
MSFENLQLELQPPLAIVTLNRPRVLNALNRQTLDELEAAFRELTSDDTIRVILLTGAGEKAFAAGADISELANLLAEEGQWLAARGHAILNQIEHCGKPVIACVNGFALGGGCELAMACSLRLAADTAHLGQPELKLGLIPGYGGTQRLPRLVGKGAALKILLTGATVSANEALRIGLIDEVVPAAELLPRGRALANTMAQMAPLAVRACLDVVHRGYDLPLDEALAIEASGFGYCCGTEDKAEGTRAFLEKRAPVWKGL